ncbi:MAG: hypothetical protein JEZ05_03875 [Tenericutes bacterium]|nr:hypothetical protein [Mycoplasmatota bacterium]
MKSLKTKVIMSAIVLVFALVATIGSTYAWFTVSNVVTVNSFDVNVESSEALLMRVWDGETDSGLAYSTYGWTLDDFSNVLTVTDSTQYDTELATWLLSPVTCLTGEDQTGGVYDTDYSSCDITALRKPTGNFLTPDTSLAGRELGTAAAASNTAGGGYIELKFWLLKPAGTNTDIVMSYDITDSEAGEIWEQAIWIGTYDGSTQAVFGDDLDTGFTWATASVPGFSTTGGLNSMTGTASITAATTSTVIATLATANIPELLTVYIWAEGWDADTTNDIMGATFTIDLEFTLS